MCSCIQNSHAVYLVFCIYHIQQIIYAICCFSFYLRTTPRRTIITAYRDPLPMFVVLVLVYILRFLVRFLFSLFFFCPLSLDLLTFYVFSFSSWHRVLQSVKCLLCPCPCHLILFISSNPPSRICMLQTAFFLIFMAHCKLL